MTQHLSKLVTLDEAADLRAAATPAFEPAARPLAPGVSSLFGSDAPFGSPAFAARDAGDITPQACVAPPEAIPGWRASGSLWPGERFTLRIPRAWNGRLVAAVAPGQRSEFACDRLFGDPLLARGFAYVCGNKGNGDGAALLEAGAAFNVAGVRLPRFFLPDKRSVVFWQHGPGHLIERWLDEMLTITDIAQDVRGKHLWPGTGGDLRDRRVERRLRRSACDRGERSLRGGAGVECRDVVAARQSVEQPRGSDRRDPSG